MTETTLPAAEFGGPGRADPTRCATLAIRELEHLAPGMALASLTLEIGAAVPSGSITLRSRIDRQTTAIVFATCEASTSEGMLFSARGLFAAAG